MDYCRKLLFIIHFLSLAFFLVGQDTSDLENLLKKANNSEDSIKAFQKEASSLIYSDPYKAEEYADNAILISKRIKSYGYVLSSLNLKGSAIRLRQDYQGAIDVYTKALALGAETGRTKKNGVLYGNIGVVYYEIGNIDSALIYQDKAFVSYKLAKDTSGIGKTLINSSAAHISVGQYEEAIAKLVEADSLFFRLNDQGKRGIALLNIGNIYLDKQEYQKALEYYQKAKGLFQQVGDTYRYDVIDNNIGTTLIALGKLNEAEEIYRRLVKINDFDTRSRAYALSGMGDVLFEKARYRDAIDYYNQSLELDRENGSLKEVAISLKAIGDCLLRLGEFNESIETLNEGYEIAYQNDFVSEKFSIKELQVLNQLKREGLTKIEKDVKTLMAISDTIYKKDRTEAVEKIETALRTKDKETKIILLEKNEELQKATIQRQQIILISATVLSLLLILISILFYKQSKERKRTNVTLTKQKDQIETLHQELAHRVKNNLFFISTLMKMQGRRLENEEAKQAVKEGETRLEAMSLLHRKLHSSNNENDINIGEYIQELCSNLQHSFPYSGNPPHIKIDAKELTVGGEPAVRIGLIINELVTNSFKYAFLKEENPMIEIIIRNADLDNYEFIYKDNGEGLPSEFDLENNQSMGLKLINTLTKQLEGTVNISNKNGAYFQFVFKKSRIAV